MARSECLESKYAGLGLSFARNGLEYPFSHYLPIALSVQLFLVKCQIFHGCRGVCNVSRRMKDHICKLSSIFAVFCMLPIKYFYVCHHLPPIEHCIQNNLEHLVPYNSFEIFEFFHAARHGSVGSYVFLMITCHGLTWLWWPTFSFCIVP